MEDNSVIVHYVGGQVENKKATAVTFEPGIQRIDDKAFYRCEKLTSITIPDSVTSIGSDVADQCQKDISAIPKPIFYGWCMTDRVDTQEPEGAFAYCKSLKTVVISKGVTKIEGGAFYNCISLEEIQLPNSITEIGEHAFDGCFRFTNIAIPKSVTSICSSDFTFCASLRIIVIPEGVTKIGDRAFCCCRRLQRITLPNLMTEIGECAFYCCFSLKHIVIPQGMTTFGSMAFARTGIEDVTIPDGIQIIPDSAFYSCESLHTVKLPATVEEIGQKAFAGCPNLENFVIPNGLPALKKLDLDNSRIPGHGWNWISQLVANSPNLEEFSLREVWMRRQPESPVEKLHDDAIPTVLHLASSRPSLKSIDLSINDFTPNVFGRLESEVIPPHLRSLKFYQVSWAGEMPAPTSSLLRLLDVHPKLAIWTNKFWDDSEDKNVWHKLNMNQYGCRGFRVPDSLWPVLMDRLGKINQEQTIETGVENILYHLLRRHSDFFGRYVSKDA